MLPRMAELGIVLAPLLLLVAFALAAMLVPLPVIAASAATLMASGLLVGVPSGLYYHVLLRRALLRRGALPRGWYWNPQAHHDDVDLASVRTLMPWFWLGALGFGLIVLGFVVAVAALLLWFRAQ
jgi:hypothetical protein